MNAKRKNIWTLTICMLILQIGMAQNTLDIFSLSDKNGMPQNYEISYGNEISTALNINFPIFVNRITIWTNSFHHLYYNIKSYTEINEPGKNSFGLNGFILRTGIMKRIDRTTRMQVIFSPRLMSDFYKSDVKSIQLGGIFMYEKVYDNGLTTGYGLMYNYEFYGSMISPVVNLNWNVNENLHIKGTLPTSLKLNYNMYEGVVLGINYFGINSTYYLSNPVFNQNYIERTSIELSIFSRIQLFRHFYFEGKAGQIVFGKYKQFSGDDKTTLSLPFVHFNDTRTPISQHKNSGYFLSASVVFMMPFPEYW